MAFLPSRNMYHCLEAGVLLCCYIFCNPLELKLWRKVESSNKSLLHDRVTTYTIKIFEDGVKEIFPSIGI